MRTHREREKRMANHSVCILNVASESTRCKEITWKQILAAWCPPLPIPFLHRPAHKHRKMFANKIFILVIEVKCM